MKHTDKPTDNSNPDPIDAEAIVTNSSTADPEPATEGENSPPILTKPAPEQPSTSAIDESAREPTQAATKPKRNKLALLALLLALIALGLLGYGYTLVQKMHKQVEQQTAQLIQAVEQSRAGIGNAERRTATLEQQLAQARQQSSQQQANLNELQDRLTRAMQQISSIGTDSRRDWLLAEVEYLLRLANQRVLMENSAIGALALLKSADQILKETDDVSIYNVRKALAQDIAALEAVPHLDVDGTFLRLAALNGRIDQLRLLPLTDRHQIPGMLKEITPAAVEASWQQGMAEAWSNAMDKLGKLIVIQHRNKPVEPLLSPEQNFFLKQNLHLMLEQAQLALLQGKQGSYDASLDKAGRWVATYFQKDDSTTQALVQAIKELQGIQVAPPLPDISGSLRQLKSYLTAQYNGKGAA
ncbi:MAG TPA: uroporphyrinogen-III C-methyltransferase [Motiliproteus sp.]